MCQSRDMTLVQRLDIPMQDGSVAWICDACAVEGSLDPQGYHRVELHDTICDCGAGIGRECSKWPEFIDAQVEDGIVDLDGNVLLPNVRS